MADLPPGARVAADKGYLSAARHARILTESGVTVVAARRKNMTPHLPADTAFIQPYRHRIETVNSPLENMGVQRLHARTVDGLLIKVHAALLALACALFDWQSQ